MAKLTREQLLEHQINQAIEYGFLTWIKEDFGYEVKPARLLSLCKAFAVFQLCLDFKKGDFGFKFRKDFYQAYLAILATKRLKYLNISNLRVLQRKLSLAKGKGIFYAIRIIHQNNQYAARKTAFQPD